MPEGGLVEVDTMERGDSVEIGVRDHGPGLGDVSAERLFEPFFTTRPGGTGLGLHVSRKIVDSHDGLIEAGDAPGGGALVRVVLPKRKEPAP